MTVEEHEKILFELQSANSSMGIYPAAVGGLSAESYEQRDGYKNGWNACVMEYGRKIAQIVYQGSRPWTKAERVFACAEHDVFWFDPDDGWSVFLNDTWYYASGDGEEIPPDKYNEVASWFKRYGEAGVYYWVYLQRGHLPAIPGTKRLVEAIIALEQPPA